jgi:hypothetical protein
MNTHSYGTRFSSSSSGGKSIALKASQGAVQSAGAVVTGGVDDVTARLRGRTAAEEAITVGCANCRVGGERARLVGVVVRLVGVLYGRTDVPWLIGYGCCLHNRETQPPDQPVRSMKQKPYSWNYNGKAS